MTLDEFEKMQPNVEIDGMRFLTPNRHVAWRIETLYTKETDTIEWIRGMKPDEILFDVGANIGQYTVFAAHHAVHVHAFEPEAQNFALLNRNIALNRLSNVVAWPMCLDIQTRIAPLHLSTLLAGSSCHAFDHALDYNGHEKTFAFDQGSISVAMDAFADQFGLPDHIKIDVDGFEHRVCGGAHKCLLHARSLLVEINTHYPEHMALTDKLQADYGFKVDQDQIHAAQRTEGAFAGIGNWIFFKGDSWHVPST